MNCEAPVKILRDIFKTYADWCDIIAIDYEVRKMENIRTVFLGTPEFACVILKTLVENKYNVVAAVAQPDKPVGRKQIIEPTPVHALADQYGIPVLQPAKLRKEYQMVLDMKPDLIVTCAYGQMIPDEILDYPVYGCVNVHPSLLPKYRGGAPIHHAVWSGDAETGVSIMKMVAAMDAGAVYAQKKVAIGPDETTGELSAELEKVSAQLLIETLPKIIGGLKGTEQDDSKAVLARNISKEQEQLCFQSEPIDELYNHARALIDWPISYGSINGSRIKFFKVGKRNGVQTAEPGTLTGFSDHAMEIACIGGSLLVYELQMAGHNRMNADVFANGAGRSLVGGKFE